MGLGDFHKIRGLAAMAALLGIAVLTALVPGHVVSQATAFAHDAMPGLMPEMSCNQQMAMPGTERDSDTPDTPDEKCSFCKGYAAFMSALAGAPDAGEIDAERIQIAFVAIDDDAVGHFTKHANNRGPPLL